MIKTEMSAKPANQKRRNNEKRKEKSRVAARCRRNKEQQIFNELTDAIPAQKEDLEGLDKASVMRLAISYLRARDVVSMLPETQPPQPKMKTPKEMEEVASELSYMNALDGFVLVLSQQGDIVYCSENIAEHLGVSQTEVMGVSVFELSHPCDHDDVREALRGNPNETEGRREFLLRLKCTLTGKGRNVHLKSASYKVIHITGHMLTSSDEKELKRQDQKSPKIPDDKVIKTGSLVAVGRSIPHPSNIEIPLDSKTFLSKHGLDMKFTDSDASLQTLGFEPSDLVGQSLFEYHHAADSAALVHHFKSLFSKGQCETGQYRFLAKRGGYAWVHTQATLITDKQQKPISVVCINYVISGIECKDEIFAAHQLHQEDLKPVPAQLIPAPVPICLTPSNAPNGAIVAVIPQEEERPIPVTELIFAPRKKEMNKGFLMFSQGEGLTMLKDEPEDLTHLAPTAGDACIPLENSPFDMFDDFILGDNYCSLLGDDLANGSPVESLTADSLLMSSPEPQESDSSCGRSSLLTELSLDALERPEEFDDGKSPFIPMTDELPILESAVMWGALPDNVSMARPQPTEMQSSPAPALQRLLAAPATGPQPQDLITNMYAEQGLIANRSISTWDTGVKRVLSQEEEPTAKRAKRSPSPRLSSPTQQTSESVLKNLLDENRLKQQQLRQEIQRNSILGSNYPLIAESQKMTPQNIRSSIPVPVLNMIAKQGVIRSNLTSITNNAMSPLTLNVSSPMYSLPSSPNASNYSPAMSPALRGGLSPYSSPPGLSPVMYNSECKMVSPGRVLQSNSDPYMTYRMQQSPNYSIPTQMEGIVDSPVQMPPDSWSDTEMMQDTSDLLTFFGTVKLG